MATPGFGFSVGDFIAALNLMVRVTNSLRDDVGAASQYQSLVRGLANLESALAKMQSLETDNESGTALTSLQDRRRLIKEGLEDFLNLTKKFEPSLAATAPTGWKHGTARKAQWAAFCSTEIVKLRTNISSQVENLNLLNGLLILESTKNNKDFLRNTERLLQDKMIDVERNLSCAVQSVSASHISRFDMIDGEITNLREASHSTSSTLSEASQCLFSIQASLESLSGQMQTSHYNV